MIGKVYELCGKYSCSCIIPFPSCAFLHEYMHWTRLMRKSYNYSRLLLSQVGEKVIWLFWSVLVDYVIDLWSRPYRYSIVRCPRRGTMQLHTLLGMKAVDMNMHCICILWTLFILKFYVGMKWIWGGLFLFIWGVLFHL